jgi:hypothetical protein
MQLGASFRVRILAEACQKGWEEMAQNVLALGTPVDGRFYSYRGREGNALTSACRRGFGNIVRLLLEHSANLKGNEVCQAAKKGRWGTYPCGTKSYVTS